MRGLAPGSAMLIIFFAFVAKAEPNTAQESASLQRPPCLIWSEESGRGVGLGVDVSGAATALEYQLNVIVPFSWLFAVRARPVFYLALHGSGAAVGGKLELVFRTKLLLNFVRVYGGGGPAIFYGLSGPNAKDVDGNWFAGQIDGNWFAGTEFFFDPRWSLHWEFGTSGGAFDTGAGPYVDVGLLAYLF